MTTRLYFLVDGNDPAQLIVDDLRNAGIDDGEIHAVAHRERYPLEGVPEANFTQRTDFLPAARRGVALGGTTGFLAGLAAVALPVPGMVLAGGAMVASLTAAGAAVGTWSATLIGIGITHRDLQPFEEALEQGQILILVDVSDDRVDEIEALIRRREADVVIASGELEHAREDVS
ncbi:MAG: DUF1269 domain-containing protein [Gammaproteobacteria bacterium]|nr:MAG: DUF1269 domain-containing protein [Gammaproteobacteria bacterium]